MIRHAIFKGHRDCIYGLAAHPDGFQFYTGGADGYIVRWDSRSDGQGVLVARVGSSVYALLATGNGLLLAGTHQGELYGFDMAANKLIFQHTLSGSIFSLVQEDNTLWAGTAGGYLYQLSEDGRQVVRQQRYGEKSIRSILPLDVSRMALACSDGHIRLIDKHADMAVRHSWAAHQHATFCMAWSPEEKLLVSGGRDAQIRIWAWSGDDQAPALLQEVPAHWFTVNALWMDQLHQMLYSGSRDNTLKCWTVPELQLLDRKGSKDRSTDDGHKHSINRMLWLDATERLITASDDKSVMLWRRDAPESFGE